MHSPLSELCHRSIFPPHVEDIPFAPHGVTSPIGMMSSAHLCATAPNFYVLEWHWIDELDLRRNWVKEGEIIQKGFIAVPEKPGQCGRADQNS